MKMTSLLLKQLANTDHLLWTLNSSNSAFTQMGLQRGWGRQLQLVLVQVNSILGDARLLPTYSRNPLGGSGISGHKLSSTSPAFSKKPPMKAVDTGGFSSFQSPRTFPVPTT